jgi:tetratricopeptide (TPR) repeat protein
MVRNEVERAERNHTPPNAMDCLMRGDVLFEQEASKDRYRHQQEMFERALQLDPRLPVAQLKLADALSNKVLDLCQPVSPSARADPPCDAAEADLRRADDLASQVLANHPDDINDADAHRIKGQVLRAQAQVLGMPDRLAQAAAEYQAASALDPNNQIIWRGLGRTKNRVGEPAEAIPALERSMRLLPDDSAIGSNYRELGLAHLMLGHIDEAIRWYEKAIPEFQIPDFAYLELGAASALKGDRAAAQAALAEARRLNPKFTTMANIRRDYASISKDPKWLGATRTERL